MEKFWDIINYLFGVYIIDRNDVLSIEDRRPTLSMLLSGLGLLAVVVFAAWRWLTNSLVLDAISLPFIGVALVAALVFVVRGTFREMYVFDKTRDTYIFTRQSVLKKDVLQGSLSQFRAVQVERRSDDESEKYMVALLMQGLLLGASDTQILRENPPVFNSLAAESRIANAIAKFLNIERQGVVDIL